MSSRLNDFHVWVVPVSWLRLRMNRKVWYTWIRKSFRADSTKSEEMFSISNCKPVIIRRQSISKWFSNGENTSSSWDQSKSHFALIGGITSIFHEHRSFFDREIRDQLLRIYPGNSYRFRVYGFRLSEIVRSSAKARRLTCAINGLVSRNDIWPYLAPP
jgi:hypothetical protein